MELAKIEEARKRKALIEKQAAEQTAKHLAKEQETEEERVARLSSNFKHYRLIEKVAPKSPEFISYNRVGYAVVEYNIDTNGTVVEPKIISSTPAQNFDQAVLDAVKKWRYSAEFGDTEPDIALARTWIRIVP